jgi:hypothetical protein
MHDTPYSPAAGCTMGDTALLVSARPLCKIKCAHLLLVENNMATIHAAFLAIMPSMAYW